MMRQVIAKLVLALGLLLGLASAASAQTSQQCVANALAGGTGDAITIPLLPCAMSTNLLILTLSATNSVSNPTLQMTGFAPIPIVGSDGGAIGAGQLAPPNTVLLSSTGLSWKLIPGIMSVISLPALTGDTTTAQGSNVTTTGKVHGVTFPSNPTTSTIPFVTSANTVTYESLSAILDSVAASSQGSIIYRGASSWTGLAPGANGQILATQGPGANPKWEIAPTTGVFNVKTYGATGNYRVVADAAMGSGSTTLTSASAVFTAGDVGKYIAVAGAGTAGANLFTTIAGFTNSTTIVLTAGNTSGGAISGKLVEWGTDDTAAFQAAVTAAVAAGGGTVYAPTGSYFVSQLNLTGITNSLVLLGDGVNATRIFPLTVASYGSSAGHMFDLTGSAFITLKDFQVGASYELAAPTTGIFMAQTVSNASNANVLSGIYISGQFTDSAFYNYGVPSSQTSNAKFYNYKTGAGTQDVMKFTGSNIDSLTSSFATVTSGFINTSDWSHFNLELHKFAGAGANNDVMLLDGTANLVFVGGVISGGATEYVQLVNGVANLTFLGSTFETESEPVQPTEAFLLKAASTLDGFFSTNANYVIGGSNYFAGTGAFRSIRNGYQYSAVNPSNTTAGTSNYIGTGVISTSTPEAVNSTTIGHGILANLHVRTSVAPGAGQTFTVIVQVNNSDTAITCVLANAAQSCTDNVHYAEYAVDQGINVKVVTSGGAAGAVVKASVEMLKLQ